MDIKYSYASRLVPEEVIAGYAWPKRPPRIGDLVAARVATVGRNTTLESRSGVTMYLFPDDVIVGVFGNRYATDQFEGYVPERPVEELDLMSVGGVVGEVASSHAKMAAPTGLHALGVLHDASGRPLNTTDWALRPLEGGRRGSATILVVGSSMNAGKTTTAGTLTRALRRAGGRVAAAKITGTAAGKDGRYLASSGASAVLDFTDAGYPSTYLADLDELLSIHRVLLSHLRAADPTHIVLEAADGVVQRETRLLLESPEFQADIDHVFFAAGDPMAADSGVRLMRELGLPLRAVTGAVTQSELAMREAEEATGVPCLDSERILSGELAGVPAAAPASVAWSG
jgi:hypothetical protein